MAPLFQVKLYDIEMIVVEKTEAIELLDSSSQSEVREVKFQNTYFENLGNDFSYYDCIFENCSFENCNFAKSKFIGCDFLLCSIKNTSFMRVEMLGCQMIGLNVSGLVIDYLEVTDDCFIKSSEMSLVNGVEVLIDVDFEDAKFFNCLINNKTVDGVFNGNCSV